MPNRAGRSRISYLEKTGPTPLTFKKFWSTSAINVMSSGDSSLGKEQNSRSQLRFMILLAEAAHGTDPFAIHEADNLVVHLMHCCSRIQRRAVHNSLSAACYASINANDVGITIAEQVKASVSGKATETSVCIHSITDCMSSLRTCPSVNPSVEELQFNF